jgi:hypothetical protein
MAILSRRSSQSNGEKRRGSNRQFLGIASTATLLFLGALTISWSLLRNAGSEPATIQANLLAFEHLPPHGDPVVPLSGELRKHETSSPILSSPAIAANRRTTFSPAAPPAPRPFEQLDLLSEEALTKSLQDTPEVALDSVIGTSAKLLAQGKAWQIPPRIETVLDLLPQRPDLRMLPFRRGADCQTDQHAAEQMQVFSSGFRPLFLRIRGAKAWNGDPNSRLVYFQQAVYNDARARRLLFNECDAKNAPAKNSMLSLKEQAVPVVVQLLQAEDQPLRLGLVRLLASSPAQRATVALAQRCLFDLSAEVRKEAVQALQGRPLDDVTRLLLDGLRYPWPPVAEHAAEALVALRDQSAVPALIALLDQPDPATPVKRQDKWVIPELVRVNQLRNCLLCHSPSFAKTDLVRAAIPRPGALSSPSAYYMQPPEEAIRADVTYLRQDFSVSQPLPGDRQLGTERYDYLVRQRELSDYEIKRFKNKIESRAQSLGYPSYPQREAVLFALRGLTGIDLGPYAGVWKKWFAKKGT